MCCVKSQTYSRSVNMPSKTIESVLKEHGNRLMSLPGVMGIAQGQLRQKPCIKVYVARKTDELLRQIPSTLEGYTVSVEESGEFRALDKQ
jgi:hypothetical protein